MSRTIIYFHGFGGSGTSKKGLQLKNLVDGEFTLLDFSDPNGYKSAAECKAIIDERMHRPDILKSNQVIFVGISLGGLYARIFGEKYDVPYVLVNPVTDPSQLSSIASTEFIEDLKTIYHSDYSGSLVNYLVALDDDLINPEDTIKFFKNYSTRSIFATGGHEFEDRIDAVASIVNKVG